MLSVCHVACGTMAAEAVQLAQAAHVACSNSRHTDLASVCPAACSSSVTRLCNLLECVAFVAAASAAVFVSYSVWLCLSMRVHTAHHAVFRRYCQSLTLTCVPLRDPVFYDVMLSPYT